MPCTVISSSSFLVCACNVLHPGAPLRLPMSRRLAVHAAEGGVLAVACSFDLLSGSPGSSSASPSTSGARAAALFVCVFYLFAC